MCRRWAASVRDAGETTGNPHGSRPRWPTPPRHLATELNEAWQVWETNGAPDLYEFGMIRTPTIGGHCSLGIAGPARPRLPSQAQQQVPDCGGPGQERVVARVEFDDAAGPAGELAL